MSAGVERVLAEQVRYYRARAPEYEEWWLRRGRYDHGPDANARWFEEAAQVQAELERFRPTGRVLELACGTGLWTQRLAAHATSVTALDAAPEALAIARAKAAGAPVELVQADVFEWEPDGAYDVCFFAFWLSHVPSERMPAFWDKVRRALAPGGRVFLLDSARSERASARDHTLGQAGRETERRRIADGREFEIVKHWFDAAGVTSLLEGVGWSARIEATAEFFVYGSATPGGATPATRS